MFRLFRGLFERWGFTQSAEPSGADDTVKRARDAAERATRLAKESAEKERGSSGGSEPRS